MADAHGSELVDAAQPRPATDDDTIDLLEMQDFLDAETVAEVVAELERAGGAPATVLGTQPGGVVQPRARKVTRVAVSPETGELIRRRLMDRASELEAHFGVAITACEDPQFLRYEPGDFFVPHQDGNTPLVYDDSRFRRISAVIFLSRQSDEPAPGTYGGGDLVFHGPYGGPEVRVVASSVTPGTLVAFRSETTHEVTIVTHGVRYSIATWLR
jgi:SM-20-related protein